MLKAMIVTKLGVALVAYAKVFGRAKALNDGTNGYRFNMLGLTGIYRERSTQKRYGLTEGETTVGYHHKFKSVYFEKSRTPRFFWNLVG